MLYLSIDIEASGLFPGIHYLVSVGAVPVVRTGGHWSVDRERTFYVELQPTDGAEEMPESMAVHGLTRDHLLDRGVSPRAAMRQLADYLESLGDLRAAAWPASFDIPYLGWHLYKLLGRNPLGHSALDIPSFAMGLLGVHDRKHLRPAMARAGFVPPVNPHKHNALADAVAQAETLVWLLERASEPHP